MNTEYNPHLPAVAPVLNRHKHILLLDPSVSAAIPPDSIFASYKQPKSIKDMLVRSKFVSNDQACDSNNLDHGCKPCKKCYMCKSYLVEAKTFKSFECNEVFTIKQGGGGHSDI